MLSYKSATGLGLLILSIYFWKRYFQVRENYKKALREQSKHNAVVIYSRVKGITGWPGYETNPYHINFKELRRIFEPVAYFINTSKETVDIALMIISSCVLTNTVLNALNKGVKIRIILNYEHSNNPSVKKLIKHGAHVTFFIEPPNATSIFHYKYAIKDYGTKNQAVYTGSLNWTDSAFSSNYEDLIISSNEYIVERFHENFVSAFEYIENANRNNKNIKQLMRNLES